MAARRASGHATHLEEGRGHAEIPHVRLRILVGFAAPPRQTLAIELVLAHLVSDTLYRDLVEALRIGVALPSRSTEVPGSR